jgi:hypothetical protein
LPSRTHPLPSRDALLSHFSSFGAVLDVIPIDTYAVVACATPESASHATPPDPQLTLLLALRKPALRLLLSEVERRRVYVCDLAEPALASPRVPIVQITNVSRQDDHSAIVHYDTPGAIDGQAVPVCVLPFLDRRLEHESTGLLQLNELAPAALRRVRADRGGCRCAGRGVRRRLRALRTIRAARGREGEANALLFPRVDDAMGRDFASSCADKGRGRWLLVLDGGGAELAGAAVEQAWFAPIEGVTAACVSFVNGGN